MLVIVWGGLPLCYVALGAVRYFDCPWNAYKSRQLLPFSPNASLKLCRSAIDSATVSISTYLVTCIVDFMLSRDTPCICSQHVNVSQHVVSETLVQNISGGWIGRRGGEKTGVQLEYGRSHWPRGLRCSSAAALLLKLWVRIPLGAWTFVCCECCVCCQVEVSATSWSLVQRSPTDRSVSLCVIKKPREWGGPGPLGATSPNTKIWNSAFPFKIKERTKNVKIAMHLQCSIGDKRKQKFIGRYV